MEQFILQGSIIILLAVWDPVNGGCLLDDCHTQGRDSLTCDFTPPPDHIPDCDDDVLFHKVSLQERKTGPLHFLHAGHLGAMKTESLALKRLQIESMAGDALQETASFLQHLDLSENRLTSFLDKTLHNCSNLKTIDLSFNLLTTVPAAMLRSATQLEELNLAGNQIQVFHDHDLSNFGHLDMLDLSMNKLHQMSPEGLSLTNLKSLSISNNHLSCGCPLAWLRQLVDCLCVFQYDDCNDSDHKNFSLVSFPHDSCDTASVTSQVICERQNCVYDADVATDDTASLYPGDFAFEPEV